MKKALTLGSVFLTTVATAFAQVNINIGQSAQQGQVNGNAIINMLRLVQDIVVRLVPISIGIAVLAFFWFLISFLMKPGDETAQKGAKSGMAYSILALFVMVSIWGIIGFFGSILGVNQGGNIPTPKLEVLQ